jgi:hypothetical protein
MSKSVSGSFTLGAAIVLVGVLLLIRNVFNIHIPIFTLIFSGILIYLGIMLIRGNVGSKTTGNRTMFGENHFMYTEGQQAYAVSFGSGTLNLQDIRPDSPMHFHIDCSFGEAKVIVSKEVALQIEGNAAFANLVGPDLRSTAFGNFHYTSPGFHPGMPGITLHTKVSFGELRIFYL